MISGGGGGYIGGAGGKLLLLLTHMAEMVALWCDRLEEWALHRVHVQDTRQASVWSLADAACGCGCAAGVVRACTPIASVHAHVNKTWGFDLVLCAAARAPTAAGRPALFVALF